MSKYCWASRMGNELISIFVLFSSELALKQLLILCKWKYVQVFAICVSCVCCQGDTSLENLEILGNLTAVRKMAGKSFARNASFFVRKGILQCLKSGHPVLAEINFFVSTCLRCCYYLSTVFLEWWNLCCVEILCIGFFTFTFMLTFKIFFAIDSYL